MQRVLFIQHGAPDKPGLLAEVLAAHHIALDVVHPYLDQPVPIALDAYHGLALGGGAQSAFQTSEFPYLADECQLIQATLQAGKPVIGLCLGAQLLATALGAQVIKNTQKEIGILPVHFHPAAQEDALFCNLPPTMPVTHWHSDTFALPGDAVGLAWSDLTSQQLFRWGGNAYGLQFHLEMTPEILEEMIVDSEDYLAGQGVDTALFLSEGRSLLPGIRDAAWKVFSRWAALL